MVELCGGGAPVKEGRQGLVGELRGEVGDRFRGLSRAEEGWGVEFHWSRRPAAALDRGGAAPAAVGGGEMVVEQHGDSGKLSAGSDRAKDGRKGDLHGEVEPRRRPWLTASSPASSASTWGFWERGVEKSDLASTDGLSGDGIERRGDACWHRRREAAAARAQEKMEVMAFL